MLRAALRHSAPLPLATFAAVAQLRVRVVEPIDQWQLQFPAPPPPYPFYPTAHVWHNSVKGKVCSHQVLSERTLAEIAPLASVS